MARWNFAFFDSGARFDSVDAQPGSHMRNLASFLRNPFDDPAIGTARLIAFTTDHIQRMSANNPSGELTGRITPTSSALAQVEDCITDDQGRLGLRKARKQVKDDFRDSIPPGVERVEAGFISALGGSSPVILEALPQGRTVFSTCRDDEVTTHLQTLVNAVNAHAADLAPAIVTLAGQLLTGWSTAYAASEASSGAKTTSEEGKRLARENLQLMLYLNLVKLMEMFPRQPEKLTLYMQQHLLQVPGGEDEETPSTPVIPPTP